MLIPSLFFSGKSLHLAACIQRISARNCLQFQLYLHRKQGLSDLYYHIDIIMSTFFYDKIMSTKS